MGDAAAGMQAPRNMYKRAFSSIKQTTRTHTQALFPAGAWMMAAFFGSRSSILIAGPPSDVWAAFAQVQVHRTLHAASRVPYYIFILRNISPLVKGEALSHSRFFSGKRRVSPFFSAKKGCKKLFIRPGPILRSKPHFCPDLYSRYILRRRIRRAGVSPYSASRYASGEPYSCRRVSSTNWAASG